MDGKAKLAAITDDKTVIVKQPLEDWDAPDVIVKVEQAVDVNVREEVSSTTPDVSQKEPEKLDVKATLEYLRGTTNFKKFEEIRLREKEKEDEAVIMQWWECCQTKLFGDDVDQFCVDKEEKEKSDAKRFKLNVDNLSETVARYACEICSTRLTSCEFIAHECKIKGE